MKVKTAESTGSALDWAVSHIEGHERAYSTDWAHGGPIIEQEGVELQCWRAGRRIDHWTAVLPGQVGDEGDPIWDGPTPLIAAMRCYVASKMGDTIDIPEELA